MLLVFVVAVVVAVGAALFASLVSSLLVFKLGLMDFVASCRPCSPFRIHLFAVPCVAAPPSIVAVVSAVVALRVVLYVL